MINFDLVNTLVMLSLAGLLVLVYGIRLAIKGRAQFDRVDRQGGSALLGKGLMEMAYWSLQPVARALVFCRVTPNQISWASLVFAILTGVCLAFGHFGFGAFFSSISALLDSLDGMVARMTGVASDAGEVLDAAVDRYAEFLFLGGLVIYYRDIPVLQVLALLALAGSFMVSYSTAKAESLQVAPPKGSMRRPERAVYLTLGAVLSPITIPWLETYRDTSIPVGHPMVLALCLVAVMANVSAIERFWAIARAIRVREADQREAELQALVEADAPAAEEATEAPPTL